MRRGLSGPFFMPGEAQQVERTMQSLSEAFEHSDDPVVVTLVMLNTNVLKPGVTRTMTCAKFIENTSRALEHSVVTPEQLAEMFELLKNEPFVFAPGTNEFMALSAPKFHGFLRKRTTRFGGLWAQHFFVLANSCLFYFKDNTPACKDQPLGMIQLVDVEVAAEPQSALQFTIVSTGERIQYVKFGRAKNVPPTIVERVMSIRFEAPTTQARDGSLAMISCEWGDTRSCRRFRRRW
jgi:hypothetical protein